MLRINNFAAPLDFTEATLRSSLLKKLRLPEHQLLSLRIMRKSIDARDKGDVHFVLTLDFSLKNEDAALKKDKSLTIVPTKKPFSSPCCAFSDPPLVVGAGPAGLFAALTLARSGSCPVLIERGKPVDERTADVNRMSATGTLDPESNVQFGEGGAGAFSDGKLTCGIKSPFLSDVLETFVEHGAPEEILILQKPHIGTDRLKGVVASIRREIIRLGGTVCFNTCLLSLLIHHGQVAGARVRSPEGIREISTRHVLLCIGHSARDTVQELFSQGIHIEQKPFAMGVRIEHPQAMINRAQYGAFSMHPALGAADYKMNVHTPDGRGTYTFCMCPGGEVIAAASEEGHVAVNGMSYHARAGENANSALLVGVRPEDFGSEDPLAGFALQRRIERKAFLAGGSNYHAPAQRLEDFMHDRATSSFASVHPSYKPGVTPADLRAVLPDFIIQDLKLGITGMDRMLHGFAMPDAVLTGAETRSSSPIRMNRTETGEAINIAGLYPTGEGAGYAGGIVSAAVDGITSARHAMEKSLSEAIIS